jgi:hypothetical protein
MDILGFNNLNNFSINYSYDCGMNPSAFSYKIVLSSYNSLASHNIKKTELKIYPKDQIHKNINKHYHEKIIQVDFEYLKYIYSRIKNIDYKVFAFFDNIIEDSDSIVLNISKNNFSLKVIYYPDENNENIIELNNIFEELKLKIGFKEWYDDIIKKYNLDD